MTLSVACIGIACNTVESIGSIVKLRRSGTRQGCSRQGEQIRAGPATMSITYLHTAGPAYGGRTGSASRGGTPKSRCKSGCPGQWTGTELYRLPTGNRPPVGCRRRHGSQRQPSPDTVHKRAGLQVRCRRNMEELPNGGDPCARPPPEPPNRQALWPLNP
ncbi:hypothetical protein B0H65DRAFT_165068 [Neurospora tetraspora]|uniref:Uncharacterized protein n=1 Tax=Neurospora tetraspora TaxID=94610 RepID=A0AAE0JIB2_9PEZI|nr:hypothetical protein B0H65DRAFT_165068 [Neurospora tetraspora]